MRIVQRKAEQTPEKTADPPGWKEMTASLTYGETVAHLAEIGLMSKEDLVKLWNDKGAKRCTEMFHRAKWMRLERFDKLADLLGKERLATELKNNFDYATHLIGTSELAPLESKRKYAEYILSCTSSAEMRAWFETAFQHLFKEDKTSWCDFKGGFDDEDSEEVLDLLAELGIPKETLMKNGNERMDDLLETCQIMETACLKKVVKWLDVEAVASAIADDPERTENLFHEAMRAWNKGCRSEEKFGSELATVFSGRDPGYVDWMGKHFFALGRAAAATRNRAIDALCRHGVSDEALARVVNKLDVKVFEQITRMDYMKLGRAIQYLTPAAFSAALESGPQYAGHLFNLIEETPKSTKTDFLAYVCADTLRCVPAYQKWVAKSFPEVGKMLKKPNEEAKAPEPAQQAAKKQAEDPWKDGGKVDNLIAQLNKASENRWLEFAKRHEVTIRIFTDRGLLTLEQVKKAYCDPDKGSPVASCLEETRHCMLEPAYDMGTLEHVLEYFGWKQVASELLANPAFMKSMLHDVFKRNLKSYSWDKRDVYESLRREGERGQAEWFLKNFLGGPDRRKEAAAPEPIPKLVKKPEEAESKMTAAQIAKSHELSREIMRSIAKDVPYYERPKAQPAQKAAVKQAKQMTPAEQEIVKQATADMTEGTKYKEGASQIAKKIDILRWNWLAGHQGHWFLWKRLGDLYCDANDLVNAEVALNKTLSLNPDFPGALLKRAEVRKKLGKREDALKDYQEYLLYSPNDENARKEAETLRRR